MLTQGCFPLQGASLPSCILRLKVKRLSLDLSCLVLECRNHSEVSLCPFHSIHQYFPNQNSTLFQTPRSHLPSDPLCPPYDPLNIPTQTRGERRIGKSHCGGPTDRRIARLMRISHWAFYYIAQSIPKSIHLNSVLFFLRIFDLTLFFIRIIHNRGHRGLSG